MYLFRLDKTLEELDIANKDDEQWFERLTYWKKNVQRFIEEGTYFKSQDFLFE